MENIEHIQQLLAEAWSLRSIGDYTASSKVLLEAESLCTPNNLLELGRIAHIRMQYALDHGLPEKALIYNTQSVELYKKSGHTNKIAHATRHTADIEFLLGKLDAAEQFYLEALEKYKSEPNSLEGDVANALRGYALVLEKTGRFKLAISIWRKIKSIYSKFGIEEGVQEASERIMTLEKLI